MGKILSLANFKGGVGKTSTTALIGYNLARLGKKVLLIDLDAQANLTSLMIKTNMENTRIRTIETSLMTGIIEELSPDKLIINIGDNLDLIPNAVDFSVYPRYLEQKFDREIDRVSFLKSFLSGIVDNYDYIFLDVPPTLSLLNDSAFFACDQIVIVLQTQERSLTGAEQLIQYLQSTLIDEFNANCDVLGVLPVLSKRNALVDTQILELAEKEFGSEFIFENKIPTLERIKRHDVQGITNRGVHDKNVHTIFTNVANELLERLGDK